MKGFVFREFVSMFISPIIKVFVFFLFNKCIFYQLFLRMFYGYCVGDDILLQKYTF